MVMRLGSWSTVLMLAACGGSDTQRAEVDATGETETALEVVDTSLVPGATALPGPAVRMAFARAAFFDAPVPALDLIDPNGRPDLSGWPRERGGFVDTLILIAQTTDGASLAGAIYFAFDAALPEAIGSAVANWRMELDPAGDVTCVFRDSAFENDVAKTNLAAILEQHGIAKVRSL